MTTKSTDSKGRITLGERFANRTVIVEEIDGRACAAVAQANSARI